LHYAHSLNRPLIILFVYSVEKNRISWFLCIFLIVVRTFECVLTRALVSSACDGHSTDDSCVLDYFGVWNTFLPM